MERGFECTFGEETILVVCRTLREALDYSEGAYEEEPTQIRRVWSDARVVVASAAEEKP